MMGIFERFKVKFVPQNVVVKVNCYPKIAICIKLSGSKEEKAMVKFLCCKLIADQKRMEFYNKIELKVKNHKDSFDDECEENQFKIEVLTLTGNRMPFKVDPTTTFYELKLRIQVREGIFPDQIRIIFDGKEVDYDGRTLAYFGIGDKATINMLLCSRGCFGLSSLDLALEMVCQICKKLLFKPVVLNCTHSFCQHCIGESKDVCPSCQQLIKVRILCFKFALNTLRFSLTRK